MKNILMLVCCVLLVANSVEAKAPPKDFSDAAQSVQNAKVKLQERAASTREEIEARRKQQTERMKEHMNKKYSKFSAAELEQQKKKLEARIAQAAAGEKQRFQTELDVINSLLTKAE